MSTATKGVNVVTAEIIRNALTAAALEMNKTLVRTAYNPLLYEVQDFGLGIISSKGQLWAEAPGVLVFLGCLPDTVASGLALLGPDGFAEGDVLIANDPYETGTHISDTSVYIPAFYEGKADCLRDCYRALGGYRRHDPRRLVPKLNRRLSGRAGLQSPEADCRREAEPRPVALY